MIEVAFQHWTHIFAEEELVRYGSPHFDQNTAGRALLASAEARATKGSQHRISFDPVHILCANEAFPEAALADPLADLDVWDDWRSGIRAFPYPGRYSRLGIPRQEGKTQSSSSVGVLGEIMAGLYSQAGIGPWVIVRVIRRWPDFIFYSPGERRYEFVESKAFTDKVSGGGNLRGRVPDKLLGECLAEAVAQLNADPFVRVWGAFTGIENIGPMQLQVTFLELDAEESRRRTFSPKILPEAIMAGIAERAVSRSISRAQPSMLMPLYTKQKGKKSHERGQAEESIYQMAVGALEDLLIDAGPEEAIRASRNSLVKDIRGLIEKAILPEQIEGRRFFFAKEQSARGALFGVRQVGARTVFMSELSQRGRTRVTQTWHRNWEAANQPFGELRTLKLWRCGGALFAMGDPEFEGTALKDL